MLTEVLIEMLMVSPLPMLRRQCGRPGLHLCGHTRALRMLTNVPTEVLTVVLMEVSTDVLTEMPTEVPTEMLTDAPTEWPTVVLARIYFAAFGSRHQCERTLSK